MARGGYIDTTTSIELTRDDVRDEMKELEDARKERRKEGEEDAATRQVATNFAREKRRKFAERVQIARAENRAKRHGGDVVLPRSYLEHRMTASVLKRKRELEDGLLSEEQLEEGEGRLEGRGDDETESDKITPA